MLKKYTKYAATAFAVASLSTFMIGCGEADEFPVDADPNDDGMPDDLTTTNAPSGPGVPSALPGAPEEPPAE